MDDFDQFKNKHSGKRKEQILRDWYDWQCQVSQAMGARDMLTEILLYQNKVLADFIGANGLEPPIEQKVEFTQQHFEYRDAVMPNVKELADKQGQRFVAEARAEQGRKGGSTPRENKPELDDRNTKIRQRAKDLLAAGKAQREIPEILAKQFELTSRTIRDLLKNQ